MTRAQADPARLTALTALAGCVRQNVAEPRHSTVIHFAQGVDKGVDWRHITVDGTGKHVIHQWISVCRPRRSQRPPTTNVDAASPDDQR